MLGMYVHMHWSYNHPYAARTWSLEDWRSYLTGLRSLGYDFLQVWPMLDSMSPEPNESDLAFLEKLGEAIRMAQGLGMKVGVVACPNTIGNEKAADYGFEERPYFATEWRLNPADPDEVAIFLEGRRKQFRPIGHADALVVIDSDPGGYVGSTNAEFVALMDAQIGVFREYNPNGELIYWMHFGWENYCRFWERTLAWKPGDPPVSYEGDPEVFADTLALARERIPEPWWVLASRYFPGHMDGTEALGMVDKRCGLAYGLIEGEPTFPFTNCNPEAIAQTMAGYAPGDFPRGYLGNCQTHALQLPHTYLVAHHWHHGADTPPDLAGFGDQVVPGCGEKLSRAWLALETGDGPKLRACAGEIRGEIGQEHASGPSSGLMFGDADRFLGDLAMNLDVRAAMAELAATGAAGGDMRAALRQVLADLIPYQERLGFVDAAGGPLYVGFNEPVARLGDARLNAILEQYHDWRDPSIRHGLLRKLLVAVEEYCDGNAED